VAKLVTMTGDLDYGQRFTQHDLHRVIEVLDDNTRAGGPKRMGQPNLRAMAGDPGIVESNLKTRDD